MSNITTKHFLTICTVCRVICDLDNRCNDCKSVKLEVMSKCIKHKKSLKKKLKSKQKAKEKLLSQSIIDDGSNVRDVPSSVDVPTVSVAIPSACFNFSVIAQRVDSKLCEVKEELSYQINFFFFFFSSKHMADKFSSFSDKLSQAIGNLSDEDSIDLGSDDNDDDIVSQDVCNRSFSATPPLAVRFEHNPQEGCNLSQRGGMEVSSGRGAI